MTFTGSLSGRAPGRRKRRASAVAAGLGFLLAACGGDSGTPVGPAPSLPAECTPVASPKILGATHIPAGQEATYNTTPPTSGEHYGQWAQAGGYTEPIKDETQVHNLEHGHVMVQHNGLEASQLDALEELVRKDPKMILVAPYPDMEPVLALTSWGKIQTCSAWSDGIPALVEYFIKSNRDNAPESIE
jgi:hypothetical protein